MTAINSLEHVAQCVGTYHTKLPSPTATSVSAPTVILFIFMFSSDSHCQCSCSTVLALNLEESCEFEEEPKRTQVNVFESDLGCGVVPAREVTMLLLVLFIKLTLPPWFWFSIFCDLLRIG